MALYRRACLFFPVFVLIPLLITGCGSGDSSTPSSASPEEVALQFARHQLKGNANDILRTLPDSQKQRVDSQSVAPSKQEQIQAEVLGPHLSVSADTAVIQGDNGYVQVVVTLPDLKQMMQGMSFSDKMAFSSAMKEGNRQEAESRLEKLLEKSKKSGSIPTTDNYRKVYVVRLGDGWKAVLPSDIRNRIASGLDSARAGNWGAAEEALAYTQKLAPLMDETKEFSTDLVHLRIESGRDSLDDGNLEAAEEALTYAKNRSPESNDTKRFSEEVATTQKEIAYVDSLSLNVRSSNVNSRGLMYGDLLLTGKVEVQNRGQQDVGALRSTAKVTLSSSAFSTKDTTMTRDINFKTITVKGNSGAVLDYNLLLIDNLEEGKTDILSENGLEHKEVEFTPVRVYFK